LLVWCLPSIGFLWFMVPLPFGWETMASLPLQKIATKLSCYALQLLGQPAFAEGNVILLGEHQLEVAQACSGLRLFISVLAVAYGYVAPLRRGWRGGRRPFWSFRSSRLRFAPTWRGSLSPGYSINTRRARWPTSSRTIS